MAAEDNLSHRQLAMFMTARELHKLPMMDEPGYHSKQQMIKEKLAESKHSGLHASIEKNGVKQPVAVFNDDEGQYLWDGHHRVVSAKKINPNMILPVVHYDEF